MTGLPPVRLAFWREVQEKDQVLLGGQLLDVTTIWPAWEKGIGILFSDGFSREVLLGDLTALVVAKPATHLDELRQFVQDQDHEWTTGRATDLIGVTPEKARQLLNALADEGLLVKHGVRGRLWTPVRNVYTVGGKVHEAVSDTRMRPACGPGTRLNDRREFRWTRQPITCIRCLRFRERKEALR